MIDIYDELGYIKNILESGLSQKWERDARLLVRYYKMEGYKKAKVKDIIKNKCIEASVRPENQIVYRELTSYNKINSIIKLAWKNDKPLRAIKGVTIPREVVDWFLNLEDSLRLSESEISYYKLRRKSITIKKGNPMNWNRIKYLFTLYIWVKINENFLDRPNIIYLQKFEKRFRDDAHLPQSFSLKKERNFLSDLGFIHVNYALGIIPVFMDEYEVFKTPLTPENSVFIPTGEPPDGDLYNPGYWLEKQKMGSFVCQNCGREFANYKKVGKGRPRKYCKECANLIENSKINHSPDNRKIVCIDCGAEVEISKFDNKTCRCPKCQMLVNKTRDRLRKKAINSI